jgi:hypothetical protein
VGTFVAHSPSYLPLPHPAFAAVFNPTTAKGIVDAIRTKYDDKAAAPGKALAETFTHSEYRNLSTKTADEMVHLTNRDSNSEALFAENKRRLETIIKKMPD